MNFINKFIDRINSWALSRLPSHRPVVKISDFGIQYEANNQTFQFAWNEITRITAACGYQYIGNLLILFIYFENEKVIAVTEESKTVWNELITQIPLKLENAQKYETWSLQLISQPENNTQILIYEKFTD